SPLLYFTAPMPPGSTLFPYTTLFRSDQARRSWLLPSLTGGVYRRDVAVVAELPHARPRDLGPRRPARSILIGAWAVEPNRPARPDRKSTRLNSSHVAISYAVFCLKKK